MPNGKSINVSKQANNRKGQSRGRLNVEWAFTKVQHPPEMGRSQQAGSKRRLSESDPTGHFALSYSAVKH